MIKMLALCFSGLYLKSANSSSEKKSISMSLVGSSDSQEQNEGKNNPSSNDLRIEGIGLPNYLPISSDIINLQPINLLCNVPRNKWSSILDGTSDYDCADSINELIGAISGINKPGVLMLPNGRISVGKTISIKGLCSLRGQSIPSTEIFALPGLNSNIIESDSFSEHAFNSSINPSWIDIRDLRVNGNKNNQKNGGGIFLYASRISMDNLLVMNCYGDGIYTKYTDKIGSKDYLGQEEGCFGNIITRNNDGNGWVFHGPHNSTINSIISSYNKGWGFINETKKGEYDGNITLLAHLHTYGNGTNDNHSGSCIKSVSTIGYLVVDGEYSLINANNVQIDRVKMIFGGRGNDGIILRGSYCNIGMINAAMKTNTSGQNTLQIDGSSNYIGRTMLFCNNNNGVKIQGNNNIIENVEIIKSSNAVSIIGYGNRVVGNISGANNVLNISEGDRPKNNVLLNSPSNIIHQAQSANGDNKVHHGNN
ncbi:TPA: hypothetical protein L9L16_004772 [Klebsiella quasipneumoniae subsp. quasipneumoniae]|uniref:hypothetical protein n=1 Tax=Klebsiella quasipneumoniae TaxID=1463165 RepID=UPI000B2918B1|nr:hypothetical protein [Klebsiella quasipneumoniae]HBR1319108.1 hypothetical protein [Klebsiella quasipneumoniae subsp. quasipneumoniae]